VSRDITKRKIAEEELRESEARFRTVADAAPVLIWMSGPDKLCTFFNKGWLDFTGRTMEQEMGNGWAEGVHPDDFQICLKTYVEAFDARQPFVMQYRLRRHDGEYRWISDNGVPRYDTKKNFVGYIGSCMDVTELMSKEKALREFEERVTLAARAAHLGVWEMDTTTNEIWMSDGARSLFQFEPGMHITYATFQDRVHPEDRAFRDTVVKQAIHTQGEYNSEYRTLLPDGTVRWIGGRGRCVADASGRLTRLLGVSMDVTERKEAQDLLRLATESSPSGIILTNDRGHIILVNTHVEKLFGYRREELVGKPVDILVPERFARQHPAHRAQFLAAPIARAMGAGRDLFGRRRDGSEFPVEIGLNPIRTAQGLVVLASVIDITARKQAELEHLRQNMELARVGRVAVMGELAASLAHEVNNPIGAMVANASAGLRLITAGKVEIGELNDLFTDIAADGRRAGEIVQGIRNMVRKGKVHHALIQIEGIIHDLLRIVHAEAVGRDVTVSAEVDSDGGRVWADRVQLLQVFLNLTLNAFEAMSAMRPDARRLGIHAGSNGNGEIVVSVRDSGPGFPEGLVEQLFEPFFSTKAEGTGMGLAISRSIIEAHGGTLSGENCDNGGACFTVRLPEAKEDKSKAA
jgi:PAS domain S-box-containing protein